MKNEKPTFHRTKNLIGNFAKVRNYFFVGFLIAGVSLFCFALNQILGYQSIGFILLFSILWVSTRFTFGPTMFSSLLGGLIWYYFFIPPRFTFHVTSTDDLMMFLAFFTVAVTCSYYSTEAQRQRLLVESEKQKNENQIRESLILRESEKLHQTLLNSISHELRTPLTAIIGSATAVFSHHEKSNHTREYMQDILLAAHRLQELTQGLLDMSRLSSGVLKPNFELFELNDFIHQLISKHPEFSSEHTLLFSASEEDLLIRGDDALLEVVLINLLKNAVHYSPRQTLIRLTTQKEDGSATVRITDRGPGLSENETEKLFHPFYRGKKRSEYELHSEGLGLGLSIVKSILDLHAGQVILQNRRDLEGTEVIVKLELAQIPAAGVLP